MRRVEEPPTGYSCAVQPEDTCANVVESDQLLQLLYHERFGPMDKRHVQTKLQTELGIKVKNDKALCEPCQSGKAHRQPFGNRVKTSTPGELLSGIRRCLRSVWSSFGKRDISSWSRINFRNFVIASDRKRNRQCAMLYVKSCSNPRHLVITSGNSSATTAENSTTKALERYFRSLVWRNNLQHLTLRSRIRSNVKIRDNDYECRKSVAL